MACKSLGQVSVQLQQETHHVLADAAFPEFF